MDAVRVALLREVLDGTEWIEATRRFAGSLRTAVTPHGGGLLLVGTPGYEPWHLAAHLDDEAAWSGLPELSPTLVRHRVPGTAPAHLAVGLGRLAAAGRGATLLVVPREAPDAGLLDRVHDPRRNGATVLALDSGDHDLHTLAHDALTTAPPRPETAATPGPRTGRKAPDTPALDPAPALDLDTAQHLVSAAAGENTHPTSRRGRLRDRLARLAESLAAPPPPRW
ncbi:hypothetical protein ADL22_17190 [Streptomyces sp. NRRL F-4489]|uniref:hypothetical protein n=1 Tax=Streptomyces sp. NRRL F-4489 TaxID=1609095 RepID=UPI000749740C|nr:hypothetical protein [Streptomyces sp. NRRL F-4489]KUL38764.1 hypothetical protein ADL22_17190 [Streptomyces sp. NRRL F-4489]